MKGRVVGAPRGTGTLKSRCLHRARHVCRAGPCTQSRAAVLCRRRRTDTLEVWSVSTHESTHEYEYFETSVLILMNEYEYQASLVLMSMSTIKSLYSYSCTHEYSVLMKRVGVVVACSRATLAMALPSVRTLFLPSSFGTFLI